MRLFAWHMRIHLIQALRQPAYVVSTLVFPSLFFLFFAHPNADTPEKARFLMVSFAIFAVLGVVFFQFGVSVAQERSRPWAHYVRTLPVSWVTLAAARAAAALVIALLAAWLVIGVVIVSTEAPFSVRDGLVLTAALIATSVPFCLLSLTIGGFVSAQSALPVSNLIYLLSSFAGGLWVPPNALPAKVQSVSEYLPTRHCGEIVWSLMVEREFQIEYLWGLILYTIVFGVSAIVAGRERGRGVFTASGMRSVFSHLSQSRK